MNIYNSRLPWLFAPRDMPAWAVTIGPVTFFTCRLEAVTLRWHRHEDCHKRQWRRYWYVAFLPLYLWEQWRRGYAGNRFEIEARAAEEG